MTWSPLQFTPLFKERPWGGSTLEGWGGRHPPAGKKIGESWELVDRPEDQSVVAHGHFAGKTLRWLMENHGREILGGNLDPKQPFPLLIKLLDCRERLSLQVHPPLHAAGRLRGEPKTESWFILKADPNARLMAGLNKGVTRQAFEHALKSGKLEPLVHSFGVTTGDYIFIPSGRIHAIGGGLLILEIQQNSDTTFRVFDWGRVGLDGKPRDLHIRESMESIDFNDFEPHASAVDHATGTLVLCSEFSIALQTGNSCDQITLDTFKTVYVLEGHGKIGGHEMKIDELYLLPAAMKHARVEGDGNFRFFVIGVP
jgi:mannose-6-phosphate isomerase